MKKSILSLAVVGLFAMSASAFAGSNSNNNGPTTNNYNTTNQGGAGGLGGTGVGVGVGIAGAASNASVGNVTGGNASSSASVGGVGNGIGNFSPSATIEKGAVTNTNTVNTDVRNTNTVLNSNSQGQEQGQLQGQLQGQTQTAEGGSAEANNSGNTQTINITNQAAKTYRPPVNSAFAPTIFPTAPCMGSSSVGATGTLFSISGGTTWTSEECMILETARSFDQAGYATDGLAVRCQGKWAKNAPSCKALVAKEAEAVQAAQPTPVAVTAPATAPVKATPVAATKAVTPAVTKPVQQVTVSPNGYYSVNTNPLTK